MTRKVIIDCDPGQDDAVALLLAFASPVELDVVAVTTVCGNVPLALTERNARMMCDLAGKTDMPVFAGAEQPIKRPLETAEAIHGDTGIDGVDVFDPVTPLRERHAVDFIVETLLDASEPITLVPTGPLTNIGVAIQKDPAILDNIEQIVLMGGAMREGGNRTPSAEFNILVDPDAADVVFRCGRPIVQFGLDVTHQVLSTAERVDRIRALDNSVATATANMLSFFDRYDTEKYSSKGAPLHDPCTVAWLIRPELFTGRDCNVAIETESELTKGHTAVDFWRVSGRDKNVHWVYQVDADGFYDLLISRLARYGDQS
ncbi:MAG: nucleoside hydrolase [Pseudomonadota bacterium]